MTRPADAVPTGIAAPVVMPAVETVAEKFGPWNPGIESQLPRALLPLSTMFRPENARTSVAQAEELHDLTGLDIFELVAFRPSDWRSTSC